MTPYKFFTMNQEFICGIFGVMECHIKWNTLSLSQWQKKFQIIQNSNILQSYQYAQAAAKTYAQKAQWGLIQMDGVDAGIVQIVENKILFGAVHAVILDRGPLWFDGFGSAVHIKLFFEAFHQKFPKRWGRKRRIIPEITGGGAIEGILKQVGFEKKQDMPAYQTIIWDLEQADDVAMKALKSGWRGSLNKAIKAQEAKDVTIEWASLNTDKTKEYMAFKQHYAVDKAMKNYAGISPKLLDNLALFSTRSAPIIIGSVKENGDVIAQILILTHGRCATYQVGWSSDIGRKYCAHHLLLWQARDVLKQYGITTLDLGGINDTDQNAKGLSDFKRGTGGRAITLAGHYA